MNVNDGVESLTGVKVVCREQPQIQVLPHVIRAIDSFVDSSKLWTLVKAVDSGSMRLLKRVMHFVDADSSGDEKRMIYKRAVEFAASKGKLVIVEQLCEHHIIPLDVEIDIAVALSGNLPLLTWMKAKKPSMFLKENIGIEQLAFDIAAVDGNLDTVKWLVITFPSARWPLVPAARGENLELVKWLHQHTNLVSCLNQDAAYSDVLYYAEECCLRRGDHVDDISTRFYEAWPVSRAAESSFNPPLGNSPTATDAMDWAARNGHLHVLEWLRTNRTDGCSPAAVTKVAEHGHLEILQWLNEHYGDQWKVDVLNAAARKGHLSVVQWIHINRSEGCTTQAMDTAAENGHLDMVQWLHHNLDEGCTIAAMNNAARNGHLKVVQWLHDNRSEGCSTEAIDGAASNGHLNVVKWLSTNGTEGATTDAMDNAAENGHLDVVQWLHVNRSEGCTTRAMDGAATKGHLDVVQWLHSNRSEDCTTRAMDMAASEDHLEVLQWLHAHRTEGCTNLAAFSVSLRKNYAVARWLLEQDLVTDEAIRRDLSEQVARVYG